MRNLTDFTFVYENVIKERNVCSNSIEHLISTSIEGTFSLIPSFQLGLKEIEEELNQPGWLRSMLNPEINNTRVLTCYLILKLCVLTFTWAHRNWAYPNNSNFLIPITLQPDCNILKIKLFARAKFTVWNI